MAEYIPNPDTQTYEFALEPLEGNPEHAIVIAGYRKLIASNQLLHEQNMQLREQMEQSNGLLENERQLRQSAELDDETGLLRRGAWMRKVSEATAYHGRRHDTEKHAVAMIDLDNFRSVNSALGHIGANGLLRSVADCLRTSTREDDELCRFGGDEFAAFFPNTDIEDAVAIATRVMQSLARLHHDMPRLGRPLTASIGIVALPRRPLDAAALEHALDIADGALYEVKDEGRNNIKIGDYTAKPTDT